MKATYFFSVSTCLTQIFFIVSYKKKKKSYIAPVTKSWHVIPDTSDTSAGAPSITKMGLPATFFTSFIHTALSSKYQCS